MPSFVKRSGGRWASVISMGRDPVTGRYRQVWRSGFPTKGEARVADEAEMAERRAGTLNLPGFHAGPCAIPGEVHVAFVGSSGRPDTMCSLIVAVMSLLLTIIFPNGRSATGTIFTLA
jgi:hypothetical protein